MYCPLFVLKKQLKSKGLSLDTESGMKGYRHRCDVCALNLRPQTGREMGGKKTGRERGAVGLSIS